MRSKSPPTLKCLSALVVAGWPRYIRWTPSQVLGTGRVRVAGNERGGSERLTNSGKPFWWKKEVVLKKDEKKWFMIIMISCQFCYDIFFLTWPKTTAVKTELWTAGGRHQNVRFKGGLHQPTWRGGAVERFVRTGSGTSREGRGCDSGDQRDQRGCSLANVQIQQLLPFLKWRSHFWWCGCYFLTLFAGPFTFIIWGLMLLLHSLVTDPERLLMVFKMTIVARCELWLENQQVMWAKNQNHHAMSKCRKSTKYL